MTGRTLLTALGLAAAFGCGAKSEPPKNAITSDTLTERQKDSILAQSRIPGASGVGKAMNAADSMSARIRTTDTIQ